MEINEISSDLLLVVRLIVAALLGGLVGFERERIGKEAGIRTYAAVCLGACSYTLIGLHIPNVGDSSRIIANIVTGIGFLGAGIIFRGTEKISGLTTAATLWAMASVGVAVAYSHFTIAIGTSLLIYFLLAIGRFKWFTKIKRKPQPKENLN